MIALDLRGFAVSTGAACSSGAIAPSHVLTAIGLAADRARASMRFSLGRVTMPPSRGPDEALEASVAAVAGRSPAHPDGPIAVAMSGGVDSSAVAALLVREGEPWWA